MKMSRKFLSGRIEAVCGNDVAWERDARERISRLSRGLREVAPAFEFSRDNKIRHRAGTSFAESFIGGEKEGAIAAIVEAGQQYGTAGRSTKLIASELRHNERKEVASVEGVVADKLPERPVELIGAGSCDGVDDRTRSRGRTRRCSCW